MNSRLQLHISILGYLFQGAISDFYDFGCLLGAYWRSLAGHPLTIMLDIDGHILIHLFLIATQFSYH
jgi:hypothetical protein